MTLKFITINTWFGGIVWDNLIDFIHSEKPDILALQEVYDGTDQAPEKRFRTMQEFRKEFSSFLPHDAFGATLLDTGVNIKWGNAIFSKFPINSSQTIFFDLPFVEYDFSKDHDPRFAAEGMLEGEIDINGRKIYTYSWHGVWDKHGGDTENRKIMQEKICDAIKCKKTVILGGDTNVDPDTEVYITISLSFGNGRQRICA